MPERQCQKLMTKIRRAQNFNGQMDRKDLDDFGPIHIFKGQDQTERNKAQDEIFLFVDFEVFWICGRKKYSNFFAAHNVTLIPKALEVPRSVINQGPNMSLLIFCVFIILNAHRVLNINGMF